MRNYVIINGVNSLTIQGLAIKTLPPITKPIQRNLREEIDGRDGDIVTTLGYGAYDKTIEIGLFGTFDIDEVIAYFNQKGTITFSNEADKVYYFEALDQVDYAELLKFRTANVVLHCQPFKYPLNETPLEEEYDYVEGEGTELTLNDTANAIFNKFDVLGNTSQVQYTGKNYLPITLTANGILNGISYSYDKNTGWITINGTATATTNFVWDFDNVVLPSITYAQYENTFSTPNAQILYFNGSTQIGGLTFNGLNRIYDLSASIGGRTINRCSLYIANGTTITNGKFRPMITQYSTQQTYEPYVGGTASPNPSYPQPVNVVSGDNEINICGKNLVGTTNVSSTTTNGITYSITGDTITINGTATANTTIMTTTNFALNQNTTYNLSFITVNGTKDSTFMGLRFRKNGSQVAFIQTNTTTSKSMDLTNIDDVQLYIISGTVFNNYSFKFQLEKGSTATTYEPYIGSSYPIYLGNIELCKIGTYQDYIYKDNGSWYLHKEIGKVVLDGSEDWGLTQTNEFRINISDQLTQRYGNGFCNYYTRATTRGIDKTIIFGIDGKQIFIKDTSFSTANDFKTWLENNNILVYYVLATPTNTEITDTNLIEQLENLSMANSIQGQTNIFQENNDIPFILSVSALKDGSDHLIIDNTGNIYSKPILDLEGTGIVDIYLNDTQMFEVDLSEKNEIVIDTEKMEAYNPTDNTLANRQVTGDYSKFKLDSGENDLRFSGDLTKATITKYIRWL